MIVSCASDPALFNSTHRGDHAKAAGLCAACPILAACEERRQTAMLDYGYGPDYGFRGTWAGVRMSKPAVTVVSMRRGRDE